MTTFQDKIKNIFSKKKQDGSQLQQDGLNNILEIQNINLKTNYQSHSPISMKRQVGVLEIKSKLLFSIANNSSPKKIQNSLSDRRVCKRNSLFPSLSPSSTGEDINLTEKNTTKNNIEGDLMIVDKLDFFNSNQPYKNKFSKIKQNIICESKSPKRNSIRKNGINVINFAQQRTLIQPKFMEEKGSMCITELIQILCNKIINLLENNSSILYNFQMARIDEVRAHQTQQILKSQLTKIKEDEIKLSRNIRMTQIDRDYTQSYKPYKMRENVNFYQHVKDEKQNMKLTQITPDTVVNSYGLKNEIQNAKATILQKSSFLQKKEENSHQKKSNFGTTSMFNRSFRISQESSLQNINQTQDLIKSASSRSIVQDKNYNSSEGKNNQKNESILYSTENNLNQQIFEQYKIPSINLAKKQFLLTSSKSPITLRQKIRASNTLHQTTSRLSPFEQEYYVKRNKFENKLDIRNQTFLKNFEDNSNKMSQLNKIKNQCEDILEKTQGIDEYLDKFDFDFNKKINFLDKSFEKYS